jgi:iron complex transport system permease protein
MEKKAFKWAAILAILAAALIIIAVVATAVGSANIGVDKVALIILSNIISNTPVVSNYVHIAQTWTNNEANIIMLVRLPRVLLGLLVGATLAMAGVAAQAIFKNPMADPYILGVSSGAAVGAALVIVSGLSGIGLSLSLGITSISFGAIQIGALIGGMLATFLVFNIARNGNKIPVETLILSGIAVSAFFSAITSFLMYISGHNLNQIVYWIMGALWNSSWNSVMIMIPTAILGGIIIFSFSRDLNMLLLGDEAASNLGTNTAVIKIGMLALTSLIAAVAVSVSGIIGFVGLFIPHIMRLIVGPDHRILVPSSVLAGAIFLALADTFSRMIIQPTEIPVGIITALVGVPFFVYLLIRKKRTVA